MSLPLKGNRIAAAFGRKAANYDANADVQVRVAARLSEFFPGTASPRVLEVGCGTGLLTGHLLSTYPDGNFLITDIAPEMIERCHHNHARSGRVRFSVADAQLHAFPGPFDLIVSSMAAQWFDDPAATLRRLAAGLAPGGCLLYAAPGSENLAEWDAALREAGLPPGRQPVAALPGIVAEERITMDYGSSRNFLRSLKAIGADTPSAEFMSQTSTPRLRQAMRIADERARGQFTWHIVYGRIDAGNS